MSGIEKIERGKTLNTLPALSEASRRRRTPIRRFLNWSLAPIVTGFLKLWFSLGRTEIYFEEEAALDLGQPYVLACWHEQLFGATHFLATEVRKGRRLAILISPSVDGDLAANVALFRGSHVVRGSAAHSGGGALRTLISAVRTTGSTAFVVTDGPKGPARQSKLGAIALARVANAPLVPLVCVAGSEKRVRSWDRLRIPSPFAKKVFLVGAPTRIPRELDEDGLAAIARQLDDNLERLTARAEALALSTQPAA